LEGADLKRKRRMERGRRVELQGLESSERGGKKIKM
jgi:hypothetical protein